MDNIVEQLERKRTTAFDIFYQIIILLLTFVLATAALFAVNLVSSALGNESLARFGAFFGVIIACGIMLFGIRVYNNTSIEYEYTLTKDQLDIDKIINKKKRKHMLSVCVKDFERFGAFDSSADISGVFATIQAIYDSKADSYYAVFEHETYGKTTLIFNPNDKMLSSINDMLPAKLKGFR